MTIACSHIKHVYLKTTPNRNQENKLTKINVSLIVLDTQNTCSKSKKTKTPK